MAIYKRGNTYWYEFQFNGERIQLSAQTGNKDVARQVEAAHRVRLAKGEAGIVERPPAPPSWSLLRGFNPRLRHYARTSQRPSVSITKSSAGYWLTGSSPARV
jgi:hypothetical protein